MRQTDRPHPSSDLVCSKWVPRSACRTSSWTQVTPPVQETHFENHCFSLSRGKTIQKTLPPSFKTPHFSLSVLLCVVSFLRKVCALFSETYLCSILTLTFTSCREEEQDTGCVNSYSWEPGGATRGGGRVGEFALKSMLWSALFLTKKSGSVGRQWNERAR